MNMIVIPSCARNYGVQYVREQMGIRTHQCIANQNYPSQPKLPPFYLRGRPLETRSMMPPSPSKQAPQAEILRFESATKGILPYKMSAAGENFHVLGPIYMDF